LGCHILFHGDSASTILASTAFHNMDKTCYRYTCKLRIFYNISDPGNNCLCQILAFIGFRCAAKAIYDNIYELVHMTPAARRVARRTARRTTRRRVI
jgi:hypothetical protein